MDSNPIIVPAHRRPEPTDRHTVIPTPRSNGMFPGWGVRF
jgi:hypothetical protein